MNVPETWREVLRNETSQTYFADLSEFVLRERKAFTVFPSEQEVFSALQLTAPHDVRVVIVGQDPYHGFGQANGLCFSVNDGIAFPPSLINIFKEIQTDLDLPIPISGNLERWADQGVLLLNATLTVRESEAGSHQNQGWEIGLNSTPYKSKKWRVDFNFNVSANQNIIKEIFSFKRILILIDKYFLISSSSTSSKINFATITIA